MADEEDMDAEDDQTSEKESSRAAGGNSKKDLNVAGALIAAQPSGTSIVAAVGASLRAFDLKRGAPINLVDETSPAKHGNAVRCVAFDTTGNMFASSGDDKLVKLWDARAWKCLKTIRVAKKVSQVSFSHNAKWLLFADKYGIVSAIPTIDSGPKAEDSRASQEEPAQLLGHCCSIITGLAISFNDTLVASADRDWKIRVTRFPADPSLGAPVIESFCLGHTLFVTCVAFIGGGSGSTHPGGLLVSGGGDGMIRLWEPSTGKQLQWLPLGCSEVSHEDGNGTGNGVVSNRLISALAVAPDSYMLAVAVEGSDEVPLLRLDAGGARLRVLERVRLGEGIPPTSLSFDPQGRLWAICGGVEALDTDDAFTTQDSYAKAEAKAHEMASAAVVRVRMVKTQNRMSRGSSPDPQPEGNGMVHVNVPSTGEMPQGEGQGTEDESLQFGKLGDKKERIGYFAVEDEAIEGGRELLSLLQGKAGIERSHIEKAVGAAEASRRSELSKREFSQEEREFRKRKRNDRHRTGNG